VAIRNNTLRRRKRLGGCGFRPGLTHAERADGNPFPRTRGWPISPDLPPAIPARAAGSGRGSRRPARTVPR
jgi:hypothetical protein